ncbi:hypothetical protein [Silvibacterium bohemicum]|uniref:hypothetical protein n=1 Tax=Silvibacterium bohemicum TaxID=1577686 RepID=UPI0016152AF6|nr:hypothetical protein [Silvibacterium bohemicum]
MKLPKRTSSLTAIFAGVTLLNTDSNLSNTKDAGRKIGFNQEGGNRTVGKKGRGQSMKFTNDTGNQHYVSQVEQRLNSFNPQAEQHRQRIYSFKVRDRETFTLDLDSPRGCPISKNLALQDLFSFEVASHGTTRLNFEEAFQQYEDTMEANTIGLLAKLDQGVGDIKQEILEIFVAKLMNFFRNPYSVTKVLNTVGDVLQFHPTDPVLLAQYQAVLDGRKPQQAYLCEKLEISQDQYRMWLAALFLMLMRPAPDGVNFLEGMVKALFENPSGFPMVCVYRYAGEHADKRCLLSDRGFANPLPEPHLAFNFNLRSTAFITYIFGSVDELNVPGATPRMMELYRQQKKDVRVVPFLNDLTALARYNQNVMYQCYRQVYCSSPFVHGVNVQGNDG